MDLIDRHAAIDALAEFVPYAIYDESTESYTNGLTDAYNLICQLPSAEPERKCGTWNKLATPISKNNWYCSECGNGIVYRDHYCPNCGAYMR